MTASVNNCCGDPSHCGGCSVLGSSAESARRSAAVFTSPSRSLERRSSPRGIDLRTASFAPAVAPRKIGLFERLIAGPQGDPSLREDFLSFLGCLGAGTGAALLLVAIVLFFRTVSP